MAYENRNNELISVIIPVYKVERFLRKCLDSVINQTYTNLEIILVDDGSPDNCGNICDEYAKKDKRIKVIHKENGGASTARNVGINMAKGDYITFVDADDYIKENYCERLFYILKKYDADIARCDDITIDFDGRLCNLEARFDESFFQYRESNNFLYPYYRLSSVMILIKKELFSVIRYQNKLVAGEDGVLVTELLLSARNGVAYTPEKLYYIVTHDDSSRHRTNNSLLDAFYVRQHLNVPKNIYEIWASDFVERCCIEYIQLLKQKNIAEKDRMKKIVSYMREYKKYEDGALGKGFFSELLFKILVICPPMFNSIYKVKYMR